jgi:glycosyltransferase involved in cell wall biosynthesis
MKLLFVYSLPPEHAFYWVDGLWAALQELGREWDITYLNRWDDPNWVTKLHEKRNNVDFVLGWGAAEDSFLIPLWGANAGLCFGGGDLNNEWLGKLGVVFVENESQLIKSNFKQAFGTNTNLFGEQSQPKLIDALYPAAFASWKHQEIFADICQKENLKGLAVGYIQENNMSESMGLASECINKGVAVMNWIPAESLAFLYNMSKEVIITADPSGGCERTILEAKACGIPVRVVSESQKLHDWNKLTPEEVRTDWNHVKYAEALKKGINESLRHG